MKREDRAGVPWTGGASLLTIFAVLCLCVLAMLCVSTAQAQDRIAQASLESVTAYYEADLEAQRIFARLRNGEQVPGVETKDDLCFFVCRITNDQQLEVLLRQDGEGWTVLRWQAVAREGEAQDTLPVWDGK